MLGVAAEWAAAPQWVAGRVEVALVSGEAVEWVAASVSGVILVSG